MKQLPILRASRQEDLPAIEDLYRAAFPEEDLLPLVRNLLSEETGVLSLVATRKDLLVGHVVFTHCVVEPGKTAVALLGPLCAAPDHQKEGIGSQLVLEGVKGVSAWQAVQVLVLGDPAYYSRFGFRPGCRIAPPNELPLEWAAAWQSLNLVETAPDSGNLKVPPPWQDKALWSE